MQKNIKNDELLLLVGNRIKFYRELKGLSQLELANLARMDQSFFSKLEKGQNNSSIEKLLQIATALDVDLFQLFQFDESYEHIDSTKEINKILECLPEKHQLQIYKLVLAYYDGIKIKG